MPRYFFDIVQGDLSILDEDGGNCRDDEQAEQYATAALVEMHFGGLRGKKVADASIAIRHEDGTSVALAVLHLAILPADVSKPAGSR